MNRPPFEYVSRPPYISTLETPAVAESVGCPTIWHAIRHVYSRTIDEHPWLRLIVDSRGMAIHVLQAEPVTDIMLTDEMRGALETCAPQHAATIFNMEMAARGLAVMREEGQWPSP